MFDINYLAYVEDFFDEKAYNIFADPEGMLGVDRTVREIVVKKLARDCEGTERLSELKARICNSCEKRKANCTQKIVEYNVKRPKDILC